jgi:two-component system chemotaxis response regulator CheY
MKALVVDDSMVMRKVLAGVLNRADISEIDQCEDGEKAVTACENVDYDLILMDYHMPNLTGIEAIHSIRSLGKTMPIIMVSTDSAKERIIEAMKAGAQNYIVKPFESDTVLAKINATLGRDPE